MQERPSYSSGNGGMPASFNDQHLACVLLLDTSSSMMNGKAIEKLNAAVESFQAQCMADDALCRSLDIAVVGFSTHVTVLQEFTPIAQMRIPVLEADGQTAMGAALTTAVNLLERRKSQYRELGVPYHRPWVFMITDGEPNDEYAEAFQMINEMQRMRKLELWAVGVPGYQREILTSITKRVIELDTGLNFAGLFDWLSASLSAKSVSRPGERVQYEMLPEGSRVVPGDWSD